MWKDIRDADVMYKYTSYGEMRCKTCSEMQREKLYREAFHMVCKMAHMVHMGVKGMYVYKDTKMQRKNYMNIQKLFK